MAGRFRFEGTQQFDILAFDAVELEDVIQRHGIGATLRPALICPCARRESKMPRIDCPSCAGVGRLYLDGCAVMVLLLSRRPSRSQEPAGTVFHADATATFPCGFIPGRGDLLLPDDEIHLVDELLWFDVQDTGAAVNQRARDAGLVDVLPVDPATGPHRKLLYPVDEVQLVAAARWTRSGPRTAREGTDFVLEGAGVRWVGEPLDPGDALSIRYRAPAAYVVEYDPALYRQESGIRFPFRCSIHRLDRWSQRDQGTQP